MSKFLKSKWAARFLEIASHISGWSKDPSTKVGCVLVSTDGAILSTGYNGLPMVVNDAPERMERPAKYIWTVHAEAAAVANAARLGAATRGATAFVTHACCSSCARLLINAGVRAVVFGPGTTSMPAEEFEAAAEMFREAGVGVRPIAEVMAEEEALEKLEFVR